MLRPGVHNNRAAVGNGGPTMHHSCPGLAGPGLSFPDLPALTGQRNPADHGLSYTVRRFSLQPLRPLARQFTRYLVN